jgi:hypothetical protein
MTSSQVSYMAAGVFVVLFGACGIAVPITAPVLETCTRWALKVETGPCDFQNCGGSVRIPVDLGTSPPVARLGVGRVGFLMVGGAAADGPKGCLSGGISQGDRGLVQWVSTDTAVLAVTPRPGFGDHAFVNALATGEAVVYAQVPGVGRVDFAHCPGPDTLHRLDSCVSVSKITVTP